MYRFLAFFLAALLAFFPVARAETAQTPAQTVTSERTQTTLLAAVKSIHAGEKFWTVLHIHMQPGWHTYWKNPGDSGTVPQLKWALPEGFRAGEIQYLGPERLAIGPLVDYGYSDDAYYLAEITAPPVLGDGTARLMLKAQWLVCKDVCIPETGEFSLMLPVRQNRAPSAGDDAALIAGLTGKLPAPASAPLGFRLEKGKLSFNMKARDRGRVKNALYFPAEEGFITNAAGQEWRVIDGGVEFTLTPAEGALPNTSSGLVSLFMNDGARKDYEVTFQAGAAPAIPSKAVEKSYGDLLTTAFYAFLGGLILNLMPCVFPILSLKCLAVARKAAAHKTRIRAQGLAYTAGVIVSFLALALALVATEHINGATVGWGFQMQSPLFVAAMACLFFAVGLNLSGVFEVPSLFGNLGGKAASKDDVLGSFLTGILAVLVATPCTAPFMAPAIGYALSQPWPILFIVFMSLGLGLAMPFLLISLFPELVRLLPRPGAWMQTFRQFLAFPMYGCCIWFIWVLTHEAGMDASIIILAGLWAIAFAIWLLQRLSTVIRFLGLMILIGGLSFSMMMIHPGAQPRNALKNRAEPFSPDRLKALQAEGKPVFVDATADWCITCKVNEHVALSSPGVAHAFEEKHIVYMIADWTRGDKDITEYLKSFGRRGVPVYVYYPAGAAAVVLPQLLTESIVLEAIQ